MLLEILGQPDKLCARPDLFHLLDREREFAQNVTLEHNGRADRALQLAGKLVAVGEHEHIRGGFVLRAESAEPEQ